MDFYQQHAIITGGSSGIGKATAIMLAREGAHVSIIARHQDRLKIAKAEIEAERAYSEQRIIWLSADVADRTQIEQAIATAIEEVGTPDLLITSAGIAHPGYFHQLSLQVFEETMAINYFGTLYAIEAVLPLMMQKQQGHIAIVSSGAGLIGIYGYTPYSPTKFALRGLAESLRGELKYLGIHISIVYPPDTDTPQLAAENLTKPAETKLITGTAKTWSAEGVAKVILRGIKRKEFAITPGLEMKLLHAWHSCLAPILNWYFDGIVSKVRRAEKYTQ